MQIVIAGCGGFASEVEGWLRKQGVIVDKWLDDVNPTITNIDDYKPLEGEEVLVCISDPKGREQVVERLKERGAAFHGFIDHLASPTSRHGGGCITMPRSVISAHAKVGDFVHVGLSSLVGHHVTLGDFCTLSSQVDLCGHVTVGRRVFFGSGARVLPRLTIGDDAVIGAGAVVIKDVPAGATVFGNPASKL